MSTPERSYSAPQPDDRLTGRRGLVSQLATNQESHATNPESSAERISPIVRFATEHASEGIYQTLLTSGKKYATFVQNLELATVQTTGDLQTKVTELTANLEALPIEERVSCIVAMREYNHAAMSMLSTINADRELEDRAARRLPDSFGIPVLSKFSEQAEQADDTPLDFDAPSDDYREIVIHDALFGATFRELAKKNGQDVISEKGEVLIKTDEQLVRSSYNTLEKGVRPSHMVTKEILRRATPLPDVIKGWWERNQIKPSQNESIFEHRKKIILPEGYDELGTDLQDLTLRRAFFDAIVAGLEEADMPLHPDVEKSISTVVFYAICGNKPESNAWEKVAKTQKELDLENTNLASLIPLVKRSAYQQGVFVDPLISEMQKRLDDLGLNSEEVAVAITNAAAEEDVTLSDFASGTEQTDWFVQEALWHVSTLTDDGEYDADQSRVQLFGLKRDPAAVSAIVEQLRAANIEKEMAVQPEADAPPRSNINDMTVAEAIRQSGGQESEFGSIEPSITDPRPPAPPIVITEPVEPVDLARSDSRMIVPLTPEEREARLARAVRLRTERNMPFGQIANLLGTSTDHIRRTVNERLAAQQAVQAEATTPTPEAARPQQVFPEQQHRQPEIDSDQTSLREMNEGMDWEGIGDGPSNQQQGPRSSL